MKKSALHFAGILCFALLFVACKKDSYSDHLSGNWESADVTLSDLNLTGSFKIDLHLAPSNQFTVIYQVAAPGFEAIHENLSGIWQEDGDKEQFTLKYSDGSIEVYRVLELTAEKMKAETTIDDKILTVTLAPILR